MHIKIDSSLKLNTKIQSNLKKDAHKKYTPIVEAQEHLSFFTSYMVKLGIKNSDSEPIKWLGAISYINNPEADSLYLSHIDNDSMGDYKYVGTALLELAFRISHSEPKFKGRITFLSTSNALYFYYARGFMPVNDKAFAYNDTTKQLLQLCEEYSQHPNIHLQKKILSHCYYNTAYLIAKERLHYEPNFKEVIQFGVFANLSLLIQTTLKVNHGRIQEYKGDIIFLTWPHKMHLTQAAIQKKKIQYGLEKHLGDNDKFITSKPKIEYIKSDPIRVKYYSRLGFFSVENSSQATNKKIDDYKGPSRAL